jgi:hypothetical protein
VPAFIRTANHSSAAAPAAISTAQTRFVTDIANTAREHRTGPARSLIAAVAGVFVLASCASGGAASPAVTATTTVATTAPTTVPRTTAAPTTVATTIPKPPPVTLPVPTIVTVPVANTAVAPVPDPGAVEGGDAGVGGNASADYGPFGPFTVGALDEVARAAVASAVEAYILASSVLPLRNHEEPDLRAVLTPAAMGRLNPQVMAVLADGTESGLPRLEGVALERAEVGVDGIVGPDGGQVAAASINTLVTATTEGGSPVRIARLGNLLLVPGPTGWQIDDFDLVVERELP